MPIMIGIGVDVIEIGRIEDACHRWSGRFLERIYSPREQTLCRNRPHALAARFAAKEAVMKALGTGTHGVGWREIEILRLASGQPQVRLAGKALQKAQELGWQEVAVSLSHSRDYAVAVVVSS